MLTQMQILVPVLVFVAVACIGAAVLVVRYGKIQRYRARLDGAEAAGGDWPQKGTVGRLEAGGRLG